MDTFTKRENILKRHFLIVLLLILCNSQFSFSQNKVKTNSTIQNLAINDHIEKPFYPKFFINYSFINAIGKFRNDQYYSAPYPPDESEYMESDNYEASMPGMGVGFSFEIGNIFWVRKLKLNPQLKLGIMAVYQDFQFIFEKNNTEGSKSIQYNVVKGGPIFSYNPIGALLIDVKGTLELTINAEDEGPFFRGGVGMDLRYKRLSLGLDFSFGKDGFDMDSGYEEHHFSTSIMRITFGLNFLPLKDK